MASILTTEESKALLALCRTGRLYEVEDWIRAGKSLRIAEGVRGSPLQMAVEKGFRSLIELLVRNESQVKIKNKALAYAVEHRRMDLVEFLVKNGAEIASVPFVEGLRGHIGPSGRGQGSGTRSPKTGARRTTAPVESSQKLLPKIASWRTGHTVQRRFPIAVPADGLGSNGRYSHTGAPRSRRCSPSGTIPVCGAAAACGRIFAR
jgi:hypothetical protein